MPLSSLSGVSVGNATTLNDLMFVPLFFATAPRLSYVSLTEALASARVTIGEVDEHGRVSELTLTSTADAPVLGIEGEELMGAKQNRMLNTSILVPAGSSITLPVSCTEAGRWSYTSIHFQSSGYIAPRSVRHRSNWAVTKSLADARGFVSDQSGVWSAVDQFSERHAHQAPSRAMRDVYEARRDALCEQLRQVRIQSEQIGLGVVAEGVCIGLELVSRPEIYSALHERLVASYLLDLPSGLPEGLRRAPEDAVNNMLRDLRAGDAVPHTSPGAGRSFRLNTPFAHGAVLAFEGEVLHLCAFASEQ